MDKLNRLASWREHWVGLRVLMTATLTQEDLDSKRPASMVTTEQHALMWLINFTTMLWLTALYKDADDSRTVRDVRHFVLAAIQRGVISIPAQLLTKLLLTVINRERRQDKVGDTELASPSSASRSLQAKFYPFLWGLRCWSSS
jgi:hypothetical protein